ncbi:MAG TPA: N-acetyltransferase [Acidimicrobiales bacterium]|jgi:putative acetyltransferase|nr:N-acetyltransferase [Acidimicrobiales bacterium]
MTVVRIASRPEDEEGILAVVDAAFSDATRDASEELGIVRGTWAAMNADQLIELVADDDGTVVAHVLAAPGRIDSAPTSVAGVAPVCVAPSHQRRGIGTALMQSLVVAATTRAWPLLLLLGDPAYYARFGFEPAGPLGLTYAPAGAGSPHFQARRLDDYDARQRGAFTYCWE